MSSAAQFILSAGSGLANEIKRRLGDALGSRLCGVVAYGSRVRDDAQSDSDLDLLVLLNGGVRLGRDLDTIIRALYPLQLRLEYPIHAAPVDAHVYESGAYALYRNARREGITL